MRARILDTGMKGNIKDWERDDRHLDVGIRTQANEQHNTYNSIP